MFLVALGQQLQCDIFAFDYSGYGRSSGQPREANVYSDVRAVYECLRDRYAIDVGSLLLKIFKEYCLSVCMNE